MNFDKFDPLSSINMNDRMKHVSGLKSGKINGKGIRMLPNGERYKGDFINDEYVNGI